MQTSKLSVVIGALLICAPLTMRATDTAAQAAARAVVEQKLKELDGQAIAPATGNAAPVVIATPAVTTTATTEPMLKPINQTKAEKAAAKLKAKQDAERATAELKAQKEAARKAAADKAKAERAAAKTKMETAKPAPMPVMDAGKDIGLKPVTAPALPIGASKEARLQALLAKYQADQISPEDYHKQRAAILAQP